MESIAVLIPCYNEEKTIRKVIQEIKENLPNAKIYVGDNNSNDRTAVIAREEKVTVIEEKKQGKSNMVKKMFEEIDSDFYVLIDGDDTYYPEDIITCVNVAVEDDAELVIGNRLYEYENCKKKKIYSLGNWLANKILNMRYKSEIEDVMSGLRVLSRKIAKEIKIESEGFELETELTVFAIKHRYPIASVPIRYRSRPEGSKSKLKTFKDGLKISKAVLKM